MSAQYEMRTLDDLARIPCDRLEACLRDLQYAIQLHILAFAGTVPFEGGIWSDDNNHSVSITSNGDTLLELVVTDSPSPDASGESETEGR